MNYHLENLKKNLRKRTKKLLNRGPVEATEFDHMVPAWAKAFRFVYKRRLIFKQDLLGQSDCFEKAKEYFYHGYVMTRESLMTIRLSLKKHKAADVLLNLKTGLDQLANDPARDSYQILFSPNSS